MYMDALWDHGFPFSWHWLLEQRLGLYGGLWADVRTGPSLVRGSARGKVEIPPKYHCGM